MAFRYEKVMNDSRDKSAAEALDEEDQTSAIETSRRKQSNRPILRWAVFAIATLFVSILAIVFYNGGSLNMSNSTRGQNNYLPDHLHPADKHNGRWTNCGTTIDTAIARGCQFDMMGNNWIPTLCHDSTFADAAASATGNDSLAALFGTQKFEWFEQSLQREPIEDLEKYLISKARRGDEVAAYTTENWHIAHCMYWFSVGVKAMDRLNAGERGVWIPRVVRKPEHAHHCSMITGHLFREKSLKEDIITPKVLFGYATCVQLA